MRITKMLQKKWTKRSTEVSQKTQTYTDLGVRANMGELKMCKGRLVTNIGTVTCNCLVINTVFKHCH